jgi:hypothetical protein
MFPSLSWSWAAVWAIFGLVSSCCWPVEGFHTHCHFSLLPAAPFFGKASPGPTGSLRSWWWWRGWWCWPCLAVPARVLWTVWYICIWLGRACTSPSRKIVISLHSPRTERFYPFLKKLQSDIYPDKCKYSILLYLICAWGKRSISHMDRYPCILDSRET